jgi:hypothetical protein
VILDTKTSVVIAVVGFVPGVLGVSVMTVVGTGLMIIIWEEVLLGSTITVLVDVETDDADGSIETIWLETADASVSALSADTP